MTTEQIKELLIKSIRARFAEGFTLVRGDFGYHKNQTCCALSAIDGEFSADYDGPGTLTEAIAEQFGISGSDVWQIIFGFDESTSVEIVPDSPFYLLGKELGAMFEWEGETKMQSTKFLS